jgi:hypothetical protein
VKRPRHGAFLATILAASTGLAGRPQDAALPSHPAVGRFGLASAERRALEIETPVGVLAARVAEVNVRLVSDNETVATVVTGTGEFSTPFATCELRAGTTSFGHRSKACTPPAATDVGTVVGWSRPLLP